MKYILLMRMGNNSANIAPIAQYQSQPHLR